jgi:hypothetical protein
MILTDPQIIADATPTNRTFKLRSSSTSMSEWIRSDSTPDDTTTLKIQHRLVGKGAAARRQHNITVTRVKKNATTSLLETSTTSLSVNLGKETVFVSTDIDHQLAYIKNILTAANMVFFVLDIT